MPRKRWVDKTFEFALPVDAYPGFLETLASAPDRLDALVRDVAAGLLTRRSGSTWSIQENVGHLVNVDALFTGRLDDYDAGLAKLRAADMSNQATEQAAWNARDMASILALFREVRGAYLARLATKPADYFARVAWHPRLQKPMRVVDQLEFQVAHDAHHIERIGELL